uniref:Putative secreted protein n=1 Tax=Rhipicephalus microplus TaxID=6941 RepID=A0A6M2D9I4_RHIMP
MKNTLNSVLSSRFSPKTRLLMCLLIMSAPKASSGLKILAARVLFSNCLPHAKSCHEYVPARLPHAKSRHEYVPARSVQHFTSVYLSQYSTTLLFISLKTAFNKLIQQLAG